MVNTTRNTVAPNPFNMNPRQPSGTKPGGVNFEQQLSTALSESLTRLGVSPGAVNITITNNGNPSARQILITYNADTTEPVGPSTSPEATPSAAPDVAIPPAKIPTPARTTNTEWSMWQGPKDGRDEISAGGGKLTASGAPFIELSDKPAANQYGYTGLAALNPYFTTPSNPLRQGYVLGFGNWFKDLQILGAKNGPIPANRLYNVTEEGAQEALRLVRQYEPSAELTLSSWNGGPFSASNPMYYVTLPGERMMNAGLLLAGYYNHGEGVTISSDEDLRRSIAMS